MFPLDIITVKGSVKIENFNKSSIKSKDHKQTKPNDKSEQ